MYVHNSQFAMSFFKTSLIIYFLVIFVLQDGSNSAYTNIFKVALLPQHLFDLCMAICQKYDDGELIPPSNSGQRQRRTISNSSFSFLQGLNPLEPEDLVPIGNYLYSWMDTKIRPTQKVKTVKQVTIQGKDEDRKKKDLTKEIAAIKKELKDEKAKTAKLKREIVSLEKVLKEEKIKNDEFASELKLLKRNFKCSHDINQVLVSEMEAMKEELETTKVEQQNLDLVFTKKKADQKPESANKWHKSHARHSAELQHLRKLKNEFSGTPVNLEKEIEEQEAIFTHEYVAEDLDVNVEEIEEQEAVKLTPKEPVVDMKEIEEQVAVTQEMISPKVPDVDMGESEEHIKSLIIPPRNSLVELEVNMKETNIGQYVAVAYSNCPKFYIGEVVKQDKKLNVFEISFLTDLNGDNKTFTKVINPKVETAHQDQVFQQNVEVQINGEELTIVQSEEINNIFVRCRAKLVQKEKIEKVKAVWDDLSAPYRTFPETDVTWKDLKTLQLDMPDLHESFLVTLLGDNIPWQRGWLNDRVMDAYLSLMAKKINRNGKKIITADTFFFKRIEAGRTWRPKTDLSLYKKLMFVGQFQQANHWALGVVDLENSTISEIDPLMVAGNTPKFFQIVRTFLQTRSHLKERQWMQKHMYHPLQTDGVSCGVFVLKIAECIMMGEEIEFSQNDIDYYRHEIAYRLMGMGKW